MAIGRLNADPLKRRLANELREARGRHDKIEGFVLQAQPVSHSQCFARYGGLPALYPTVRHRVQERDQSGFYQPVRIPCCSVGAVAKRDVMRPGLHSMVEVVSSFRKIT